MTLLISTLAHLTTSLINIGGTLFLPPLGGPIRFRMAPGMILGIIGGHGTS